MIVKPKKKYHKLKDHEIRIINIDHRAVSEILWEHLMEHQEIYFDIDPVDEKLICQMDWDHRNGMLTYAVLPMESIMEGKKLDFEVLRKTIGITTKSVYSPNRYQSVQLNDKLFLRK